MPRATRTERKKATVNEIAAELGISKMTVSRALRGESAVAPKTLARVQKVARRLKYRPNRLMRAVHTGRSRTVGVMVDPCNSFHSGVLSGIHRALAAHDYVPILHYPHQLPTFDLGVRDNSELNFLHRLLDQRVDGIIFRIEEHHDGSLSTPGRDERRCGHADGLGVVRIAGHGAAVPAKAAQPRVRREAVHIPCGSPW